MKIEIWSDFACPFCYLGMRRLEEALSSFANASDVTVQFKSFELDASFVAKEGRTIHDELAIKYATPLSEVKKSTDSLVMQGKAVGINYNFDDLKPSNTLMAHQIARWAAIQGYEKEVTAAIFKAHFEQSINIGLLSELTKIVDAVGLSSLEAQSICIEGSFIDQVRRDEQEAVALEVKGVPFFVIDGQYAINGAQSSADILDVLNKIEAKK